VLTATNKINKQKMRFLLIPDKFKGSVSSIQVIESLKKGIIRFDKSAKFTSISISDGGDGFLESLKTIDNLDEIFLSGKDSLMRDIKTSYLLNKEKDTAYIELANSSGLSKLENFEKNPLLTTTYGTGIEIKNAIDNGVKNIIIGIGGSSTNDFGLGMMSAIGVLFLDKNDNNLIPKGSNLSEIVKINFPDSIKHKISKINWKVVNDVSNITFGEKGCAKVYGKQKGASKADIKFLEDSGIKLHEVLSEYFKKDISNIEGSGAAGASGYGLKLFTNCEFINGIELIFDKSSINKHLLNNVYDYVITGEGRVDQQTLNGKAVQSIIDRIRKYKIPTIIICGKSLLNTSDFVNSNIEKIISLSTKNRKDTKLNTNTMKYIEEDIYQYLKER